MEINKFKRLIYSLIPTETLERLKDFEFWKEWRNNTEILEKIAIEDLKKQE